MMQAKDFDFSNSAHVSVSWHFEQLTILFFSQSLLMWLCSLYQVLAIYRSPTLLTYRFQVSRINKLVLVFGAFNLYLLFRRRLSAAGRMCSGEHLNMDEWWANYHPYKAAVCCGARPCEHRTKDPHDSAQIVIEVPCSKK